MSKIYGIKVSYRKTKDTYSTEQLYNFERILSFNYYM